MGRASAIAFADAVEKGAINLAAAVEWHLTANHYPPLSASFVPFALRAIELARDEDDSEVVISDGRDGRLVNSNTGETATAFALCEAWHLWDFVVTDDDIEYGLS